MIKVIYQIVLVIIVCNVSIYAQTWETITSKNDVQDIYCSGDYCWVASTGGVVRVNIHDFTFEEFDVDDGLLTNKSQIITTFQNQVWIGSHQALTIMGNDGIVNDTIEKSFLEAAFRCVEVDNQERLWIGTNTGALVFDGTSWEQLNAENSGISSNAVLSITTGPENQLWFGTSYGISIFDGHDWQYINMDNSELESNVIRNIAFDTTGNMWLCAGNEGVYVLNNENWINYNINNCPFTYNGIESFFIDKNNTKWFGGTFGRVYTLSDTTWKVYDESNSLLPVKPVNDDYDFSLIIDIDQDDEGKMWFATTCGLYMFDGAEWKKINISEKIQGNNVNCIAIDGNNRIIYGTNYGVSIEMNGISKHYNTENSNLASNQINDVVVDSSGTVWIASDKGLATINDDILEPWIDSELNKSPTFIRAMTVDQYGTLWASGMAWGILELDGDKFIRHLDPDGLLRSRIVYDIVTDMSDNIWVCTSITMAGVYGIGVVRFDGTDWQFFNTDNCAIIDDDVESLCVDNDGTIWFGAIDGVSSFDGEQWESWSRDEPGVPGVVSCIAVDKNNHKWFGCDGDTLSKYDGHVWSKVLTKDNKIISNYISSLTFDNYDRLYIGSFGGVKILTLTATEISDESRLSSVGYDLLQNYPNPFNGSTTIQYDLAGNEHISIEIYNINGRQITTLYQGQQSAGRHTIAWNGRDNYGKAVSSGIYFLHLSTSEIQQSRRMIYVK